MLDEPIARELRALHARRLSRGELPSAAQLDAWYTTFRERFGPARLAALDGEALLSIMHEHGNYDSLVYWLEFKDDDEFSGIFGSIAGGSALKFGIYKRKETGRWMSGPPQRQVELSTSEAIAVARRHRDQLIRGAELVAALPLGADDAAYAQLQQALAAEAPQVYDTAWGHKYLSLLAPDRLDDYHNPHYQRFHLIKLRQLPPAGEGRYRCAGRYVALAAELGMPLNHLTTLLNGRDGQPHRYWCIDTSDGATPRKHWPTMRDGGCIVVGWPALGDLSELVGEPGGKEQLRALLEQHYSSTPQVIGNAATQIWNFATGIQSGDLVVAADGATMLAIGRVSGPYSHEPGEDTPHRRPVEWLSVGEFGLPTAEGLRMTLHELRKHPANLLAIEAQLAEPVPPPPVIDLGDRKHSVPNLSGVPGRIQDVLERKGQIVLYGPPGTGKTHWAELAAHDLAAHAAFGAAFAQLTPAQRGELFGSATAPGLVRMCTFHPAYGYEDFLEGYRPAGSAGGFTLRPGIFKQLCADAAAQPERRFYLIIDEINRGDIPRIFGELLTVLEKSKRGRPVVLPLSGEAFSIPPNIYVIGTMNTADRSIALLDTALRRRFGFVELMPDSAVLGETSIDGIPLGLWLGALNRRILEHIGRDARNLQIGHSYLLDGGKPVADFERFARVVQEDIVPLLEEYCYEDYEILEKILGTSLVDRKQRRIKHELFAVERRPDLITALLKLDPVLATAPAAIAAAAEPAPDEPDDPAEEPEG